MNKSNIFIETLYEFKKVRRSVLFPIFFIITVVGFFVYLFIPKIDHVNSLNDVFYFSMDKTFWALPSSIAYKSAYYFDVIQLLFLICFITNDSLESKYNAKEVLLVRPQSNNSIVIGKFLAEILVFTLVNFVVFMIAILINVVFYPHSFQLSAYLFYWGTLNFPALIYFSGISYFIVYWIQHRSFSMLVLLLLFGGIVYWGAGSINGLLDPYARYIPNMFSDFVGHVNLVNYLLQRGVVLFVGIGFLTLAVILYPRIPNNIFSFQRSLFFACGILILVGGLAYAYNSRHNSIRDQREMYKRVYREYGKQSPARVIQNNLYLKELENGDIEGHCEMNIENRSAYTIPLIIYLNPDLIVNNLEVNGKMVSFHRDYQAIIVDKELCAGDKIKVSINYVGNIEKSICFLDTDSKEFNPTTINNIGIYYFGYSPAFCEKEYKLLTPECIWYPVCVPPYGEVGIRDINYSRFSLSVEHNPRLTAISQGNSIIEKKGITTFMFEHDMSGISLCVGNYMKKAITVDSTLLTLYYLPEHGNILTRYNFSTEKLKHSLLNIKNQFELQECIQTEEKKYNCFDPRKQYPYRWLTLLEVPCDFYCFPKTMQPTGEREQGGIVFLPEKMYSVPQYPFEIPKSVSMDKEVYMLRKGLSNEINMVIGGGSCSIRPMLRGRTIFISSAKYPILNNVFSNIARGGFKASTQPEDDYLAVEYLKHNSLNDALHDKFLSPRELENIIRKKSEELHMYLSIKVGEEQFRQFHLNFLANNLFKEVNLDDYFENFYQTFNLKLDSIIENWYNANKLAMFKIQDARIIEVTSENDDPYLLYSFKVFNVSDVSGIVATDDYQGWIIPAGEGREIRTRDRENNIYKMAFVGTPLAQNLPATIKMKHEEVESGQIDTTTGVIKLDSSMFPSIYSNDEIIVDNEDAGFRIVKQQNMITSLFRKKESRKAYSSFMPREDLWVAIIKEHFYGFPVRSALFKNAGSGKQKVEWNVASLQGGEYEVFFYYTTFSGEVNKSKEPELRYYTVFDGKEEHEVVIPIGNEKEGEWVSLGIFNFGKNARVTLSDRGKDFSNQSIVADAIKWVKVKNDSN